MTKATYRSKLGMIRDMMDAIETSQDGAITSTITRKANISYYFAVRHLKQLSESGIVKSEMMLQERSGHTSTVYRLTQIGHELKKRLDTLSEDLSKMNLNIL